MSHLKLLKVFTFHPNKREIKDSAGVMTRVHMIMMVGLCPCDGEAPQLSGQELTF